MTCEGCGSWHPADRETGYDADGLCFDCDEKEIDMGKEDRGFAGMKDRDRQREIARQGGIAAHKKGTAHKYNSKTAREAGRLGGLARAQRIRERKLAPLTPAEKVWKK